MMRARIAELIEGRLARWAAPLKGRWDAVRGAAASFGTGAGESRNNFVYTLVLTVWLTLSIASVIVAAINWRVLSSQLAASDRAASIREEAEGILKRMLDAETALRGFIITADEPFLDSLRDAQNALPAHLDRLVDLTRNDPGLLREVIDLRVQTELHIAYQTKAVQARQDQGFVAAASLVRKRPGSPTIEAVRNRVQGVVSGATVLSDPGVEKAARSQLRSASMTSLVAGIIGIGAGFLAFYITRVALRHQRQEKQLLEDKLLAERNSAEKSAFMANMSHEIRTPMNAILGFSELLGAELREPRHRQYLASIRTSATSLLRLINDVLEISKIESGVLKLQIEPTDPAEICDFVRTVFREQASRKGLRLECHAAADLPRALLLDRLRLRQILVNLVGNAVKFTDQGGVDVNIGWEREDTNSRVALIVTVQDTGMGIPEEKLQTIFQPFVQAGANREKERQGTGLGLAIVLRLTEMMGGTITIGSAVGEGTRLELRFPDVPMSAQLAVPDQPDPETPVDFDEFQPSTLLAVDDNETNLQLIAGIFGDSHHKLIFATDGRQAVDLARTLCPHVVLLDIRMSGMGGREALREIRKTPGLELLPVIAVTASSLQDERATLDEGFNGHLLKPFSRQELFDRLAHFLVRSKRSSATRPAQVPVDPRDSPASEQAGARAGLVGKLDRLLVDPWPVLCDGLAVNATQAFADTLRTLGEAAHCRELVDYAAKLALHAEGYDVCGLERELLGFPNLVRDIQARAGLQQPV